MAAVFKVSVGQPIRIFVVAGDMRALVTGRLALVECEPMAHDFVNTLVVEGGAVPVDAVPSPAPPAPGERFCR